VTPQTIQSNVEKRPRVKGGAPSVTPYGAQDSTYEARLDRKHEQQLKEYYDQIVSKISDARAIFIMGPGQAKTELRKRLEESGIPADSLTTASSDKLSDAQIVEKIKIHYGYPTRETF
jgi:stalled ribosome rescue protein Dom34